jgi:RimJ/RimL family protein N-acetyltransferase
MVIKKVLETTRLILREIQTEDFDDLFRMNSDPQVMKYVGDGSTRGHDQMLRELDMLMSHYVRKPGWASGRPSLKKITHLWEQADWCSMTILPISRLATGC